MYYPYLRGKQNELILLRENAELIARSSICPIIEPVKKNLSQLKGALAALAENNAEFILVVNPSYGDFKNDSQPLLQEIIGGALSGYDNYHIGYIASEHSNASEIAAFLAQHGSRHTAVIHYGFPKAKALKEAIGDNEIDVHIFIEKHVSKLYQKQFADHDRRVLIRDGFERMSNRDYPPENHFSDLHLTYAEEGVNGFGDFLIVGDDYLESGGPAYTVAIHLTYLDEDDDMFIKHFLSDRTDTPVDPGGKFLEALDKLMEEVNDPDTEILRTAAVNAFGELHSRGHFPGLGFVKRLSMQHHVELLANYLSRA